MSLEEVGELIGCTKGHLSQAENGKGHLALPLFVAYCRAIQTPASRILEDRFSPKDEDIDRQVDAIVKHRGGGADLAWLAGLSQPEYRLAVIRAREAIVARTALIQARAVLTGGRIAPKRKKPGSVIPI